MSPYQEFRNLPNPIDTFEALFIAALEELLPDLADAPWYVREREVVNLFVFGHLIPQFQTRNLDVGQISIEVPTRNIPDPENTKGKLGVSADIIVWLHKKATLWRTCRPLARIEWKNISCREKTPRELEQQHEGDIRRLNRNQQLACLSYAVLTDQRDGQVQISGKRISEGREPEDLFSQPIRCAATCPDAAITVLQGGIKELLLRSHMCPECIAHSSATPLFAVPVSVSL